MARRDIRDDTVKATDTEQKTTISKIRSTIKKKGDRFVITGPPFKNPRELFIPVIYINPLMRKFSSHSGCLYSKPICRKLEANQLKNRPISPSPHGVKKKATGIVSARTIQLFSLYSDICFLVRLIHRVTLIPRGQALVHSK